MLNFLFAVAGRYGAPQDWASRPSFCVNGLIGRKKAVKNTMRPGPARPVPADPGNWAPVQCGGDDGRRG